MLLIEKTQLTLISEILEENEKQAIKKLNIYKKNKNDENYQEFILVAEINKKTIKKYIPLLQEIFNFSTKKINTIFDTHSYGSLCNSYLIYPSTFFKKIIENDNLKPHEWWNIELEKL